MVVWKNTKKCTPQFPQIISHTRSRMSVYIQDASVLCPVNERRRRHLRIVDMYLYFPPGGLCPPGLFLSIGSRYQSTGAFGLLVFSFPAWSRAWDLFPGCYALIHVRSISVSVTLPDPSKLYPVRPFAELRRSLHVQCMRCACIFGSIASQKPQCYPQVPCSMTMPPSRMWL